MADISNQEIVQRQQQEIELRQQLAKMIELYEILIKCNQSSELVKKLRRDIYLTSELIDLISEEIALLQGGKAISA